VVPLPMAQKAEKKLSADDTSAVRPEHESLAEELMILLTDCEFWFLLQAQCARGMASLGQLSYVCDHCQFKTSRRLILGLFSRSRLTRGLMA
jgi:hypothetical protein